MKRGVLWTNLLLAAIAGGVGAGVDSRLDALFTSVDVFARAAGQETSSGDFRSVEPNEFELAADDQSDEGTNDSENAQENDAETPTLELPAVPIVVDAEEGEETDERSKLNTTNVETLPPEAVALPHPLKAETVVDEAEKNRLKNDPLFREFSAAFDEAAPLPAIPGLESTLNDGSIDENGVVNEEVGAIDGAGLERPFRGAASTPESSGNLAFELDSALAISNVDLSSLEMSSENRATLERLDAEIARLCPLWIDAELNKNVVGRRERIWDRNEPTRFETNEPEPVALESDCALAPDAPFFFQVVASNSGAVFYTKAGDFEPVDDGFALVRDGEIFALSIAPGPGVPSGRAERTRVLTDGKIQGVDAAGSRVVDFNIGTIQLYLFDNPSRLESADGVFFVPTPESGEPRLAKLSASSKIGVRSQKLILSNGRPDELLARIVVLSRSKKRLVEILKQPRLGTN